MKVTISEMEDRPTEMKIIRENRYLRLLNKVIRSGVKTKVLMLSATPVNNRFLDLRNQIALAYEGQTDYIDKNLIQKSQLMIYSDLHRLHLTDGVSTTVNSELQKIYSSF